jgi:MFS family permease
LYSGGHTGEEFMRKDTAALVDSIRARDTPLKHALMGLGGASIEWYDFLLYGTAAALVFPTVFFPATLSPFVAVIASFSTFAVGFVARPVGAVLFGHMGDRAGRKTTFAVALITMGTATTLIGVLPSYSTAGVFAPLTLVLLRITQGLAVGGQWGGAILLATENAPKSKRGLYGSIAQAGVTFGLVMANLAFLIANDATSPAAFMAYGWRIPFLISIVLVGLGLFIHYRVEDTAAFRQLKRTIPSPIDAMAGSSTRVTTPTRAHRSPVLDALRLYPRSIFLAAGAWTFGQLSFYILITYVVAYGTSAAGLRLPRSLMLSALLLSQVALVPTVICAGALSDRYGRRRIFMTGALLMGIWAFFLFPLIETRSLLWITVAIGVGIGVIALSYGPLAAMFAELFGTHLRYSAVSLAYQISAILGGGMGPIIATALYSRYHTNFWLSVFISGACVMSLACVSILKETYDTDLVEHTEPTVA